MPSNPETAGPNREYFLVKDQTHTLDDLLEAAKNFNRVDKHPTTEASALRTLLTDALYTQDTVKSALPKGINSWATARLIEICLDQELRLGLKVREIDNTRTRDQGVFMGRLAIAMSIEERQLLEQALGALKPDSGEILLRRLSGEGILSRPGEIGIDSGRDERVRKRLNKMGYPYLQLAQNASKFFPEQRNSIFEDLEEYLPFIDEECNLLADRLTESEGDFDRIALSLFDAEVTGRGVATILASLNSPPTHRVWATRDPDKYSMNKYRKPFGYILEAYGIKNRKLVKKTSPLPPPLENTPEVEQFILDIMAETDFLLTPQALRSEQETQAEEARLAQLIEAGVWAELKLALKSAEPSALAVVDRYGGSSLIDISITDERLREYAQEGHEAFAHFLRNKIVLASDASKEINSLYGNNLTDTEALFAGLKGMYRAIRKFDYKKGHQFNAYAVWWVSSFVERAVLKQVGISAYIAERWKSIMVARQRLQKELAREPSWEEIAKKTGFTAEEAHTIEERATSALGLPPGNNLAIASKIRELLVLESTHN